MTGAAAAGDDGRTRYTIDVRLFLVAITAAMAMSFGAGVAFGPSPSSMTLSLTDLSLPAQGSATPVQQHRRLPTTHSAELGKKISESHVNFETPVLENMGDGAVYHPKNESGDDADDEEHLPAGQHLLVDIKNIEAAFLNSESRLAQAMVDVVKAGGLTLLSYHCHSLLPAGVSCVGVLLESHISFHTWPDEGVITLDLFTCGSSPLLPVVPVIEELFGIPRSPDEKVITLWAHELRGFRHQEMRKSHYLDDQSDLAYYVTSPLDMHVKRQIVSTKSPYQQIDIWDVMDIDDTPTYEDGLLHNLTEGDPRWLTNEVASPERLLFLDGTLQVRSPLS
jgi:S-adenosylmethionine decarboxylase proenzyme